MRTHRAGRSVLLRLREPGLRGRRGPRRSPALLAAALLVAFFPRTAPARAAPAARTDEARELLGSGQVDQAAALLAEVLREDPGDVDALTLMARTHSRQGRALEAFRLLRRALALRPGEPGVRGSLKQLRKPLVRELRGILRARPGDTGARHALAFLLAQEGKVTKARRQLRKLTAGAPGYAPGWQDLGWLEVLGGSLLTGRRALGRALQLDPSSPWVGRHYGLVKDRAPEDGSLPGDPFYGLLAEGAAVPDEAADPEGEGDDAVGEDVLTTPEGAAARIAFQDVDLADDSLVSSLLRRIERDTGLDRPDPDTPEDPGEEPDQPEEPDVVPTPLEVVRKLRAAYERGQAALEKGRYEEAERAFALVVSVQEDYRDAEAQLARAERGAQQLEKLERAELVLDAGDASAALQLLSTLDWPLVEVAREDVGRAALMGDAYYLAGKFPQAERHLQKALARSPRDPERRFRLVMALAEQQKAAEALEQLSILDAVDAEYARAQPGFSRALVELYIRRYFLVLVSLAALWVLCALGYVVFFARRKSHGDFRATTLEELQEALRQEAWEDALERAGRLDGVELESEDRARVQAVRITAEIGLGELEEAEGLLRKFEKDHPREQTKAWVLRGRLHLVRRQASRETLPYLRELLQTEPANMALLELLNEFFQAEGDHSDLAHEVLRRLLDLEPDSPEYILQEARFRLAVGDTSAEAAGHFERALAADPASFEGAKGMGLHLAAAGAHLDSLGHLKQALAVRPDDVGTQRALLECFLDLSLYAEGIREFTRLSERVGGPEVEAALSRLRDLERRAAERDALERAEEKELGSAYNQGVKLFSEGRHVEALPLLQQAEEAESYRLHAGALAVKSLLALDRVEDAGGQFARIDDGEIPSDEFMIGLCYDMAVALQARGEYEQACDLYRRVCKADVDYRDAFDRFEDLQEQLDLAD